MAHLFDAPLGRAIQRMALVPVVALAIVAFVAAGYPQDNASVMTTLNTAPSGSAQLFWDPTSTDLTVAVSMTGLFPNTTHLMHIHAGTCGHDMGIVYPLNPLTADGNGNAIQWTTIHNVAGGIPASGWFINTHLGSNMGSQMDLTPIACGQLSNPGASLDWPQGVSTTLSPTMWTNGMAHLSLMNGNLMVMVHVSGLAPGSRHSAHIHSGSCTFQGGVVYPLTTLVANSSGVAMSMTTIPGVSSIPAGWYVNVHYGDMSVSSSMDAAQPIACGDVAGW
jgi:hypothetical protein